VNLVIADLNEKNHEDSKLISLKAEFFKHNRDYKKAFEMENHSLNLRLDQFECNKEIHTLVADSYK
jgi:hypothetical protein